jgi:Tfp pilus assembly protein PilF
VTRINPTDGQAVFLHAKALTADVERLSRQASKVQAAHAAQQHVTGVLFPMWTGQGRGLHDLSGARGAGGEGGEEAVEADLLISDPQAVVGVWRQQQREWEEEAVRLYAKAAELTPHATVFTAFADALTAAGRAEEAELQYNRAIELDGGTSTTALLNLGAAFASQVLFKFKPSVRCSTRNIARLLQLNSYPYTLIAALLYLSMVLHCALLCLSMVLHCYAYLYQARYTEAAAAIEKAISIVPTEADSHNNHAAVLLKTGDTNGAMKALQTAVTLAPGYAKARCVVHSA